VSEMYALIGRSSVSCWNWARADATTFTRVPYISIYRLRHCHMV